jgi:hypothetical protein
MVPSKDTIGQCVLADAKKLQCPVANFLKNTHHVHDFFWNSLGIME